MIMRAISPTMIIHHSIGWNGSETTGCTWSTIVKTSMERSRRVQIHGRVNNEWLYVCVLWSRTGRVRWTVWVWQCAWGAWRMKSTDVDECCCCGSLHDSFRALCPACNDAGCKHFGGECKSDHKPVL